jgi:hypothetical protein
LAWADICRPFGPSFAHFSGSIPDLPPQYVVA